jgi:hypothetical protein
MHAQSTPSSDCRDDPPGMSGDGHRGPEHQEASPLVLRYWLEFACWTTLALIQFLYWIDGPAVSEDQFVFRAVIVGIAACGAMALRGYHLLHQQRL